MMNRLASSFLFALSGCFVGVLLSAAMAMSLWDGPPENELRAYNLYSATVFVACVLTIVLLVAYCWKNNDNNARRLARLAAYGLVLCAVSLCAASVLYASAAPRVRMRAYLSLPIPLLLWVIAAALLFTLNTANVETASQLLSTSVSGDEEQQPIAAEAESSNAMLQEELLSSMHDN
jgi:integral membrane sensor domain MASE1